MTKPLRFKPLDEAQAGTEHRTEVLPALDRAARPGGRPKDFPGQSVSRVNAFIPDDLAWKLKEHAHRQGKSISVLVAEWVRTL
jgi:hypothetical protein